MADPSTTRGHLLQAAFRYLEKEDVNGLRAILQECPEIARMREARDGRGLIHVAAEGGRVDMLTVLLDMGADPNMRQGKRIGEENGPAYLPGDVPLLYAARAGHEEATALLLARGASANAADHCDRTPLHVARTPQIAEALLKAGADPNAICWLRNCDETLGWYFAGSPLHTSGRDVAMIRTLVSHGARVDTADHITRRTALHYAAARGNADAVKALLELGADPNAMCELSDYGGESRMTPLHYAAQQGHADVVRALLEAGAEVGLQGGRRGETARDLARDARHDEIASILRGS